MEKLRPRAVIFDLGCTLIEYESITWAQVNVHCAANARKFLIGRGYDLPGEEEFHAAFERVKDRYRKVAAETLVEWTIPQVAAELFEAMRLKMDDGIVDGFFDAYYEPVGANLYIYDDTVATLERVSRTVDRVGLISNTIFPERAHREELKRFGIESFFEFAVFSSTFGWRKPHPDIFYKAANLAGFAPSECAYIGDRYVEDVEGPAAVGMPAILKVVAGREYPADMPKAERRISTLGDLADHLDI